MLRYESSDYIQSDENIRMIKYTTDSFEPEHVHEFLEIAYIFQGRGLQTVNGETYTMERGDLVFFNFGDTHSFQAQGELGIINCLMNPPFISEELVHSDNAMDILSLASFRGYEGIAGSFPKVTFAGKEMLEMEWLFETMVHEFHTKSRGYKTILRGYVHILLTKIFRAIQTEERQQFYPDMRKIAPNILQFIEENYHRKLSLTELSRESFYNPTYFSRLFKECFGKTPNEYIIEKRMHAAMKLLATTNKSVEEVSLNVGYKDKKQFYKMFKQHTGVTPGKYRSRQ